MLQHQQYQKRYDDFPATDGDYEDPQASQGHAFVDEERDYKDAIGASSSDIGPEGLGGSGGSVNPGLLYHGRNYIVGDESLDGWSRTIDESNVVSYLQVPNSYDLFNLDQYVNSLLSGNVSDPQMARRFGTRFEVLPATTASGNSKVLQAVASGMLKRINSGFDSIQLNYHARPDLQMGRTTYLAERRRLYYITHINHRLVWGDSFDTTVYGEYGHHALEPIVDPWRAVINGKPLVDPGVVFTAEQQKTEDQSGGPRADAE